MNGYILGLNFHIQGLAAGLLPIFSTKSPTFPPIKKYNYIKLKQKHTAVTAPIVHLKYDQCEILRYIICLKINSQVCVQQYNAIWSDV